MRFISFRKTDKSYLLFIGNLCLKLHYVRYAKRWAFNTHNSKRVLASFWISNALETLGLAVLLCVVTFMIMLV